MQSPSVCLCIPSPNHLPNALTNFYEIWCVHHGTWAHLNGLLYKSLPSVCVYVYSLPLLGNGSVTRSCGNEYTQQRTNYWTRHFLSGPCRIKGESVCLWVSPILVYVQSKRWSVHSQEPSAGKVWSLVAWGSEPRNHCAGGGQQKLTGLCIPLSLVGNISVSTFPRQRRIVGGFVFYAIRVVSKESKWLVLCRTSCFTLDPEGGVVTYKRVLSEYSHVYLRKLTVKQLTFCPLHMITNPAHRQTAKRRSWAGVLTRVQLN
jgi:hypothetical protein